MQGVGSSLGFSRGRGQVKMPLSGHGRLELTLVLRKHSCSAGSQGPTQRQGMRYFPSALCCPGSARFSCFIVSSR